jgi:hypothetical protein
MKVDRKEFLLAATMLAAHLGCGPPERQLAPPQGQPGTEGGAAGEGGGAGSPDGSASGFGGMAGAGSGGSPDASADGLGGSAAASGAPAQDGAGTDGEGPRPLGAPCHSKSDCISGDCRFGHAGGFCTHPCDEGASQCWDGAQYDMACFLFGAAGVCGPTCVTDVDCKRYGAEWTCNTWWTPGPGGFGARGMCDEWTMLQDGAPCRTSEQCSSKWCLAGTWCSQTSCSTDAACGPYAVCVENNKGNYVCFGTCTIGIDSYCKVFGSTATCQSATSVEGKSFGICAMP